jgi:hypothetical protein
VSARRVATVSWGVCVVLAVPSSVLLVLGPGRSVPGDMFGGVGGASFLVMALAFASVGAVVGSRVPQNPIGWIFCATGVVGVVGILAYQYANYGLHAVSPPLAGAAAAAWLFNVELAPLCGLVGLSLLLFPTGRLRSPRSRLAAATPVIGIVMMVVGSALRPGPQDDPFSTVSNPSFLPDARGLMNALIFAGWIFMIAAVLLGAVAVGTRLRHARGLERQQLKWVLPVGAVVAAAVLADTISWLIWPHGGLQVRIAAIGVGFAIFPVVAGIAILRYRLYDIDVVVNRALVYTGLTATLAGAYLGSVLFLERVLSPSSSLSVAASTLAVAALFGPARSRIQALVDRRFYRRRYDAARTLERFGGRLRDEVDLDALAGDLRAAVAETMQPAHLSIWMRPR